MGGWFLFFVVVVGLEAGVKGSRLPPVQAKEQSAHKTRNDHFQFKNENIVYSDSILRTHGSIWPEFNQVPNNARSITIRLVRYSLRPLVFHLYYSSFVTASRFLFILRYGLFFKAPVSNAGLVGCHTASL